VQSAEHIATPPPMEHRTPNSLITPAVPKATATMHETKPTPIIRPVLPPGTNVVIFNASRYKADTVIRDLMSKNFPNVHFSCESWKNSWEMPKTRIYYLHPAYQPVAIALANWFPGSQDVIDYNDQSEWYFPDKPGYSNMVDVLPTRDLAIFIGDDVKFLMSVLR